jgi:hypothetical protein
VLVVFVEVHVVVSVDEDELDVDEVLDGVVDVELTEVLELVEVELGEEEVEVVVGLEVEDTDEDDAFEEDVEAVELDALELLVDEGELECVDEVVVDFELLEIATYAATPATAIIMITIRAIIAGATPRSRLTIKA